MPRPLVLTADPALLDDLLRLCAASGAEPDVVDHAEAAAPLWKDAPLAVVGVDAVGRLVASGLPRRAGLLLVGNDLEDAALWRQAVAVGAEHVLFLPEAEPWLVERLADAAADPGRRGRVVAVVGARGGAGATSFAVALALAGARAGRRTVLVDADAYGGGIDLALGAEDVAGPRWDAFAEGPPPAGGEALTATLPRCGEVTVLAWPRTGKPLIPPANVEAALASARRAGDLVVVDVARSFDEACRVSLGVCDVAYVLCPAEVRACASGRRIADTVALFAPDVRVVARGPAPTDVDAAIVAEALGLPLAGWLDEEPGIDVALDEGRPPGRGGKGPLAALCGQLVAELLP
jgi:secretion/DNA translocation related CpaE-like protein